MPETEAVKMEHGISEKGVYDGPSRQSSVKDHRIGEAAELYGDLHTAEEYGYVSRGCVSQASSSNFPYSISSNVDFLTSLKSRHIQFIALGGTIGTGLFLGIGRAFAQAGPLSVLLGYTFTGLAIFGMVGHPVLTNLKSCVIDRDWMPADMDV
jgi:amino acid transporter